MTETHNRWLAIMAGLLGVIVIAAYLGYRAFTHTAPVQMTGHGEDVNP